MRIKNNLKRIFHYLIDRKYEFFSVEFWLTVSRVAKERFRYFDRISKEEFIDNLRHLEARPWNLHIELTNICNADCIFCAYKYQTRKKMIMSKEVYSKSLGDYCSIGGGELRLETCVGDPLVDLNFIERIREARSFPEITDITTLTNGINLDKIGIDRILLSGISEICISTGPWDEALYQLIYNSKDYHKVRKNVTELLKKKSETQEMVLIKVLFRSNLSMKKTLELPDYQAIRYLPHKVEFNTDFDTWLGKVRQNDLLEGMYLRPIAKQEKEPCYWLYDGPIVFVDGKVGLCGCRDFDADSELIVGNIMEDSLLNIWQSERVRKLRERFWKGEFPDICRKCTSYANLDFYRSKRGSLRVRQICDWLKLSRIDNKIESAKICQLGV